MLKWLPSLFEWLEKQQNPAPSSQPPDSHGSGSDDGTTKPMAEHLEDLRRTLIRIAVALFIGFNLCLAFANRILFFLEAPLRRVAQNPKDCLQSLNVTDSFVLAMTLSFYGGVLLAMPAILYYIADFILPALKTNERKTILPSFVFGTLLFIAGVAICYYAMIPQTLKAFIKYSAWLDIKPQWTVSSYVSFVTQFMLSAGLIFEVPLVILILVRLGVVSASTVAKSRKIMIAVAVILAAILSPPDPLSMVVMAIPLIMMSEVTVWLAKLVEKRIRTGQQEAQYSENPIDRPTDV